MSAAPTLWRIPLFYLALLAALFGAWFRFNGLGFAPFSVDEYYLARSIDGVLRTGLPAFTCGGLYMRGLLLQYSAALLQWAGTGAELAPRLICAASSLLCLPAVFLLGRRLEGIGTALIAVIWCALSVWEIEIARFGRMYAPFQALFVWYMVFFLRYTCDEDRRALWPMIAMSIAGPLVWEGGIFLALANLISLFLRRWPLGMRRQDWTYFVLSSALLALVYLFLQSDFRGEYRADSWPPGFTLDQLAAAPDAVTTLRLPLAALKSHAYWLLLGMLPLLMTLLGMRQIWELRSRRFASLALLVMLLAALAHQLLVVAGVAALLLVAGLMNREELFSTRLWAIHAAIAICTLYWIVFAVVNANWHDVAVQSWAGRIALLAYQFLSFPDVIGVIVRPWCRAIPHMSAFLGVLVAVAIYGTARGFYTSKDDRAVLVVLMVLVLAAGASHPPREETRYVFFLFPLMLLIAIATLMRWVVRLTGPRPLATAVAAALALGGFALSEDFQPRHLLRIDSPEETFRVGMSPATEEHLVIRTDYRAVATWLEQHRGAQIPVINGVHGLDHYYPKINYFYVNERDPNFPDWSCRHGSVERWGGYPMLFTYTALAGKVTAARQAYLVSFSYDRVELLASLAVLHPTVVMATGDVVVIELRG